MTTVTWKLRLKDPTWGSLATPGSMSHEWIGTAPTTVDPANIGDTLHVTFPYPSGNPEMYLNMSWASTLNPNPAVLAFKGSPDVTTPDLASWKCEIIPAAAVTTDDLSYVFRAVVVERKPGETKASEDDPTMVVRGGGT